MQNIRVPGILWALAIVVIVAVIHENQEAWGITPLYWEVILVAAIGALKAINLNNDQLSQALDIIDNIRRGVSVTQTRGSLEVPIGGEEPPVVTAEALDAMTANAPPRPSKMARFFMG